MSELRTNTITVRDTEYTVAELNGRQMQGVRQRMATEPHTAPAFIVLMCTVSPKQTQMSVDQMPQAVIDAIVNEVFRLGKEDADPAKNA